MLRVKYAPKAALSLTERLDRIRLDSPEGARSVLADIERTVALLAEGFMDGRLPRRNSTYRVFLTRRFRYRIAYRRRPGVIEIIGIRHPRQR